MTAFVFSYTAVIDRVILSLDLEIHLLDTLGFESFGRYGRLDNFHGRLDLGRGFGLLRIFFLTFGFIFSKSRVSLGRFDYSAAVLLLVLAAEIR